MKELTNSHVLNQNTSLQVAKVKEAARMRIIALKASARSVAKQKRETEKVQIANQMKVDKDNNPRTKS